MPSKIRNLPSWAPDWFLKLDLTNYPGEHLPLVVTASHFRAAGASTAIFDISESLDVLTIRGTTIDVINVLGPSGAASTRWDELDFEFDNAKSDSGLPEILPSMSIRNSDFEKQDRLLRKPELDDNTLGFEASERKDHRPQMFLELLVCDTDFKGDRIFPRCLKPEQAFMKPMLLGPGQTPHLPVFMQQPLHPSPLLQRIRDMSWGRRFCSTSKGYIGWVPQPAQVGDMVCCFLWAKVLILLRPEQSGGYSLVGECYLHGLMHGEALEIPRLELQDFDIH